jgi:exosome complex component RRP45
LIVEMDQIIDRSIRDSHSLDVEALCVVAGEKVWSLRCDIHVLDDAGNVIDAATLATVRSTCLKPR